MRNDESASAVGIVEHPLIEATLREIVLTSPDVARLAGFYEDALGYAGEWRGGWTGHLSSRRLSICEGAGNAIDRAVFAVADDGQLRLLKERLKAAAVPYDETSAAGLLGDALHFGDPDGNRLVFGLSEGVSDVPAKTDLTARLQHVVYATEAVGPMLHFYRDVVGFALSDLVEDDQEDLTSVFLRCSEEHHSVAVFRAPRRRLDHICYEVADWAQIRDWADRFAERHLPLRWGPGRHGPGNNLFLFINDPDGNWLEFSAELERVEVPRAAGRWAHEERTLNSWGSAVLRS